MNLKSIVAIAAVATLGSAIASVESSVKLCRIEVTNQYSDVVVSLPVVDVGGTTNICPAACVLTNGLTNGDYMYVNVGGTRKAWAFNSTTAKWNGAIISASASDNVVGEEIPAAANDDVVPCGSSIWIHRQNPETGIFLYGQVATNALSTTAKAGGFAMIGNASTNSVKLTSIPWASGSEPQVGDQVMTIGPNGAVAATYTCSANGGTTWTQKVKKSGEGRPKYDTITYTFENSPEFSPGEGFYYKSTSETAPRIEWR